VTISLEYVKPHIGSAVDQILLAKTFEFSGFERHPAIDEKLHKVSFTLLNHVRNLDGSPVALPQV